MEQARKRRGLRRLLVWTVVAWLVVVVVPGTATLLTFGSGWYWIGRSAHGMAVGTVLVWLVALVVVVVRRLLQIGRRSEPPLGRTAEQEAVCGRDLPPWLPGSDGHQWSWVWSCVSGCRCSCRCRPLSM